MIGWKLHSLSHELALNADQNSDVRWFRIWHISWCRTCSFNFLPWLFVLGGRTWNNRTTSMTEAGSMPLLLLPTSFSMKYPKLIQVAALQVCTVINEIQTEFFREFHYPNMNRRIQNCVCFQCRCNSSAINLDHTQKNLSFCNRGFQSIIYDYRLIARLHLRCIRKSHEHTLYV